MSPFLLQWTEAFYVLREAEDVIYVMSHAMWD